MSNNNESQLNDNTEIITDTHIPDSEYNTTNATQQSTTDKNTQQQLHSNIALGLSDKRLCHLHKRKRTSRRLENKKR